MQNDDDLELDEEFYDDVVDEDFESDFDEQDITSDGLDDFDEFETADADSDQDWSDSDDTFESEGGLGAEKEKKSLNLSFNTIVIGGAVIVGLIVFGYQLTTTKPAQVSEQFTSALNLQGAADNPVFAKDEEIALPEDPQSKPEEEGFLFEPDLLDAMGKDLEGTPPMPSPIHQALGGVEEKIDASEADISFFEEEAIESIDQDILSPRLPPEDDIVEDVVAEPTAQIVEPVEISEEEMLFENIDLTMDAQPTIEEPVQEIIVEEAQPVPEMVVIEEPEPSTPQAVPSSNIDVSSLEQQLSAMAQRLADIEAQVTEIRETDNSEIQDMSASVQALKQEIVKLSTAPKAAPQKTTQTPTINSTPKSAPVVWELRAAQPGKAWVSQKGSSEIKPVTVGQSLSGLGRINSISFVSGRWVVQGTQGTIRQ